MDESMKKEMDFQVRSLRRTIKDLQDEPSLAALDAAMVLHTVFEGGSGAEARAYFIEEAVQQCPQMLLVAITKGRHELPDANFWKEPFGKGSIRDLEARLTAVLEAKAIGSAIGEGEAGRVRTLGRRL